jgi:Fe-S-cluster containining protein
MTQHAPAGPESAAAQVTLSTPDWQMDVKVAVPTGPVRLRYMLPMVQSLANRVVEGAVQASEAAGRSISCKAGCGACCRQLVPIAEVEARHIRAVVEALPEPRRSMIRARFAQALRQLQGSGLLDKLRGRDRWDEGDARKIGMDYFAQGIPCPFLEDESCSIYPDRPVACREYLVTSPAANCAKPSPESIRMVLLPFKVWTALARCDEAAPNSRFIRWVPLILAPEWAEAHPEEPPARPGPELLRRLFDLLVGRGSDDHTAPSVSPAAAQGPRGDVP